MTEHPLRLMFVDHMAVEGSRRAVYRLLAEERRWEVHLVVPPTWNEGGTTIACEREENPGLQLHISSVLFPRKTHRVIYLRLPLLLREIKPDFLYMDAEPENYAALEAVLLRKMVVPRAMLGLVSSRNIDHLKAGFPYKFSFTHRFCDFMIRRSRVELLSCRTKSAEPFAKEYATRAVYFPHSVDCSVFAPSLEKRNISDGDFTIGFVGRIVESKGVFVLMHAFARLPRTCKLVLVGNGALSDECAGLARRLGLHDRFQMRPALPHSEIPTILKTLDVLVLPSLETKYWKEQFGRVLVEAMACGVPVVASDSGGIPDVVGDAGILFKSGSVPELAEVLLDLVTHRAKMEDFAKKGRERAMRFFDVHVAEQVLTNCLLDLFEC